MNVLVVEDDINKRRQLVSFLRDVMPSAVVAETASYQSGLRAILADAPDLVLLDMSLPTFDLGFGEPGGKPRPFGGREILYYVREEEIRTRVIVVTHFDDFGQGASRMTLAELRLQLEREFPGLYLGIVSYRASQSSWRDALLAAIRLVPGAQV